MVIEGACTVMEQSYRSKSGFRPVLWIGAVLLLFVGYIHLSLVVNTFGLHGRLGILFMLNVIGALAALILIFTRFRVLGWILGIVVAGGAAFARSAMGSIPGLRTLLMGRTFPGGRFAGAGFRGSGAGRFPNGGHGGAGNFSRGNFTPGNFSAGNGSAGNFGSGVPSHAGRFFGVRHNILPVFFNTKSLGTVSIVIEVLFVILAIYALAATRRRRSQPAPGDEQVEL